MQKLLVQFRVLMVAHVLPLPGDSLASVLQGLQVVTAQSTEMNAPHTHVITMELALIRYAKLDFDSFSFFTNSFLLLSATYSIYY